ncbi:MAG: hypothetical protein NC350_02375 [Corallococcus sp.]|nr:hypothetical protein [Corallococcus sp.]
MLQSIFTKIKVVTAAALSLPCMLAGIFAPTTVVEEKFGNVVYADTASKVQLTARFENKGLFAQDVTIVINDGADVKIKPVTNYGYRPSMQILDFGGEVPFIFYGADSGGSGGYGYFYVYDVQGGNARTLFDYETFGKDNVYTAKYIDGYKVEVSGNGNVFLLDISGKGGEYLDKLYDSNGKLLHKVSAEVGGVNTVFPYYNTSLQKYMLQVWQRVTGLYQADALGYIVTQTEYDGNNFAEQYVTLSAVSE